MEPEKVFCSSNDVAIANIRGAYHRDLAAQVYYSWKKVTPSTIPSWDGQFYLLLRNPKNNWCPWAMKDKDRRTY